MIKSFVIPGKLTAEEVVQMPDAALITLVNVSTDIITFHINRFILRARQSGGTDMDRQAADRLETFYKKVKERDEYLSSPDTLKMVEELRGLSFENITYNIPTEKLEVWKTFIDEILSNDNAVAFIPKKTGSYIDEQIEILSESLKGGSVEEQEMGRRMISLINNNRSMFKNAPFKSDKPAILRSIVYNKDKLIVERDGIEFLIKKKQSGANPLSWRLL